MKDHSQFYIPVLSFLVLASVVLLAAFINGPSDTFQSYICESNRCTLQDWLSATAGWVGFGAAAVAAWLVYKQLKEQTKQTAFLLGDAEPTIELLNSATPHSRARFQLVNWNRRIIEINHCEIIVDGVDFPQPYSIEFESPTDHSFVIKGLGAYYVDGWIDHQNAPPTRIFELKFIAEESVDIEDFSDEICALEDPRRQTCTVEVIAKTAEHDFTIKVTEPLRLLVPFKKDYERVHGAPE